MRNPLARFYFEALRLIRNPYPRRGPFPPTLVRFMSGISLYLKAGYSLYHGVRYRLYLGARYRLYPEVGYSLYLDAGYSLYPGGIDNLDWKHTPFLAFTGEIYVTYSSGLTGITVPRRL